MQDKVKQFDTFDAFFEWLNAPETDGKNGFSAELQLKTQIKREAIDAVLRTAKGKTLAARHKATENLSYEDRMKVVYKALHG